jgi:hypothetical protein
MFNIVINEESQLITTNSIATCVYPIGGGGDSVRRSRQGSHDTLTFTVVPNGCKNTAFVVQTGGPAVVGASRDGPALYPFASWAGRRCRGGFAAGARGRRGCRS